MEEIRNPSNMNHQSDALQRGASNRHTPLEDAREYIQDISLGEGRPSDVYSPFAKRIKKSAWLLSAVAIMSMVVYCMSVTSKTVDTSEETAAALETHMSTTLAAGIKLLSSDDNYVGGDHTITHDSDDDETTLYVWDYAAQDGDYVQVIVNGIPLGDPFMITNTPVTFTIPTVGEVKVVGTRDGGGGITYAVYYDINHTTYFNGMEEGGDNLYTLIRE